MNKTRFMMASICLFVLHLTFATYLAKNNITNIYLVKFHAVFPALFVVSFIKRMEYCDCSLDKNVDALILAIIITSFLSVFSLYSFLLLLLLYILTIYYGINTCDEWTK